ncbi:hypothetical protein PRIPAC_74565 [Pristionchus pacificus]|uniref:Uncharacterized protein n=1 Tax=Pristionchus pacificus TaxID=54126 RepID=A0A2A6CSE3_PRIPA|nr:hypothetical protein PRIPAC_74565 [Pristionchus pacificus]|eukprot:PDM80987.1 hypothetical protein PRIPAC_35990 [Pristionchus pacificus]
MAENELGGPCRSRPSVPPKMKRQETCINLNYQRQDVYPNQRYHSVVIRPHRSPEPGNGLKPTELAQPTRRINGNYYLGHGLNVLDLRFEVPLAEERRAFDYADEDDKISTRLLGQHTVQHVENSFGRLRI